MAGWEYFQHKSGKAQVWLKMPCPDCAAVSSSGVARPTIDSGEAG